MVTIPSEETPIACMLAPGDLPARRDWIAALNARALVGHRQSGRVLELRYRATAKPDVRTLAERERACCPFLDFARGDEPDGIVLTISAPERADAFLAKVFAPSRPTVNVASACACCAGARP
jgi:hypothetical protein